MLIAIDGPAASGKGTIARALARRYHLEYLNTGLLYRAVGLATLDRQDDPDLKAFAVAAAKKVDPALLDEDTLSTAEAGGAASRVARFPEVRQVFDRLQNDFSQTPGGAVLDGRDIGTRICPDADVKLYITATPEQRARRRAEQLQARGQDVTFSSMLARIEKRDKDDRENPAGAFYQADDAHLLDTSKLSIEAACQAAIGIVEDTRNQQGVLRLPVDLRERS